MLRAAVVIRTANAVSEGSMPEYGHIGVGEAKLAQRRHIGEVGMAR